MDWFGDTPPLSALPLPLPLLFPLGLLWVDPPRSAEEAASEIIGGRAGSAPGPNARGLNEGLTIPSISFALYGLEGEAETKENSVKNGK